MYLAFTFANLGFGEECAGHFSKHAWDTLALIACDANIHQNAHQTRIAATVDWFKREDFVDGEITDKPAGTAYLHTVIEQPDFGTGSFDCIIAVCNCVEQGFFPRKLGIFGHRAEPCTK